MRETEKRIKDLEIKIQSLKSEVLFLKIAFIIHIVTLIICDLIRIFG